VSTTSKPKNGGKRDGKFFDMSFTTCRDGDNLHECTTHINADGIKETVTLRYECCYGYTRDQSGPGCVQTAMTDMRTAMQEMGATEFVELLKSTEMDDFLDKNVTLFAPTNDAVEDFRHDLQRLNAVEYERYNVDDGLVSRRRRAALEVSETPQLKDIIKGHIVEGFMDTTDFQDEGMLSTMLTEDTRSKLRINVYNSYPEKTIMANCARVTSSDHFTTNGVVHMVDRVILPATKTISQIIENDVQFRTLKDVLVKTGLNLDLAEPEGQYTLFAPTDAAFEKLDAKMKSKILTGNGCSADIIKHHMLPNVICSGIIDSKAKTVNSLNKYVVLERDEQDVVSIEGVKLIMTDIVASNGVIHVIDEVIVPESSRSVPEALEESHMTTLMELFDIAGLSENLNALTNVTVFAPSEKALKELPESFLKNLKENPEKLKEFLMYHVVTPKTCHCDFADNKILETGLAGKSLRMNKYGGILPVDLIDPSQSPVTVQCARVTHTDTEVCGGMIHTVNKVLLPPGGKAVEILQHNGKYKKLVELVKFAELETELNADGPFTFFAPTDGAFDSMREGILEKIFKDKALAKKVVNHHVLKGHLCCSGITKNILFFDTSNKRTIGGDLISVRRSNGGYLYADRAEIITCDMMADNGVVHGIDRVLLPVELEPEQVK
jgi:transforming growth factor-beta-induced protein